MEIIITENYNHLSDFVAKEVLDLINIKRNCTLCFPSGDTPLGLFKSLITLNNQGLADFSECIFIGLDEWLGMDENDEGSCKFTLYQELFNPLCLKPRQIHFFNAKASDLEKECSRIDEVIENHGGIDLMILGVGMNGHLGLNEPGVDVTKKSHVVMLDSVTRQVGQKYFKKTTELNGGITLGISAIMQSKRVIGMISGKHKASITQKLVNGDITNRLPASLLRQHPNSALYLDKESASELNN